MKLRKGPIWGSESYTVQHRTCIKAFSPLTRITHTGQFCNSNLHKTELIVSSHTNTLLVKKKSLNNLTEIYIEKYDKKVKAYSITIKDEDI